MLELLIGAAMAQAPVDRVADENALVLIKTRTWPDFYREQNVEGLDNYLADSFVIIGDEGEATEKADELKWVSENAWDPTDFRYEVQRFDWFTDNLVQVTGTGTSLRETDHGEPCKHRYTSTNLVRRAPDAPLGWRALTSHVSGLNCEVLEEEEDE